MKTLESLRLDGYTHLNCACHVCARLVSLPIAGLPVRLRPLDIATVTSKLRCKKCGAPTKDVSPWKETMQRRMR